MLIFQPHLPYIITNSWRPLHGLSHSKIKGSSAHVHGKTIPTGGAYNIPEVDDRKYNDVVL